jgi:hypothetical protein
MVIELPLTELPTALVTVTVPVVAPAGTVAVTDVDELTVNVGALVPFTETEVTPDKAVPVIVKVLPMQALDETPVTFGTAVCEMVRVVALVLQPEFLLTTI